MTNTIPSSPNELLWWQRGVIYQIYPRSFKDSDGNGVGDLPGITSKLDYLSQTLGIDAIWLSPFYPSPMADFGYDIANYTDVDPIFGKLADFDDLVEQAHRRNVHVIIDFVPNHTSDQHPWFVESRSSRNSPKRDWYVWADPKPDGGPPNNWLSVFGGSTWEWDAPTGQYYLHSFLKEQPDLNWRNPAVKAAMLDVVRFWLDRGVDGFRLDVAHFIMKDPALRDNPPNPQRATTRYKPMGEYDSQLHLHDKGHPDVHAVFREFRQVLDAYSAERPRFSVGEIHIFDWPEWASYYGKQLDELHMPFNFAFIGAAWQAPVIRRIVDAVEAAVPPGAWPNYVLSNHDEHRIASRLGAAATRTAMLLLLTLRGTPTLYYGDEIGMHDVDIPAGQEQDPFGKRVPGMGLGRDPERTPMQWDSSPNAGFANASVKPWLPVASDYHQINVTAQLDNPRSMLSLTHRLIALRRATPALHAGSYQSVGSVPDDCLVYLRQHGTQRRLVAINFSGQEQTLRLPDLGTGRVILSTELDREEPAALSAFRLRGHEGCIIELADG
jgi:alpha-glucosidase